MTHTPHAPAQSAPTAAAQSAARPNPTASPAQPDATASPARASATASPAQPDATTQAAPSPQARGVGARISVHPMTDDFAETILTALAEADRRGLEIHTDDVSTFLRGPEADMLAYITELIAGIGRTGVHTAAHVLFSRGCPGEVSCEVGDGAAWAPEHVTVPAPTGLRASAHWSLYPLDDDPEADHMGAIYAAIDAAKARGVVTGSEHFATRLDGDLADVLGATVAAWVQAGRHIRHVASHLSVSMNSPTAPATGADAAAAQASRADAASAEAATTDAAAAEAATTDAATTEGGRA